MAKSLSAVPKAKPFGEAMTFRKETKGTVVYESERLRTIYVPKDVIAEVFGNEIPDEIVITVSGK